MKKIALVAGLVLAASVAVAPLAFAQDEPSAAVKAAICANTSVEAVSGAADVAASRAQREFDAATQAVTLARTARNAVEDQDDLEGAALADRIVQLKAFIAAGSTTAADKAIAQGKLDANEALVEAIDEAADAATRLAAARLDQRNAVALEAQVATFVGTRSFGAVKTELCATPAPTTPPAATSSPSPSPVNPGNDSDTGGDFDQVGELPTAIDTGRA